MWTDLVKALPNFSTAVLTFRDADGYPYSLRCVPHADPATQSFRLDVPAGVGLQAGPASLLWHRHDEQLWNQVSYSTRGHVALVAGEWRYTPSHYAPGLGLGGVPAFVGFLFGARRATRRYLRRRHLARPKVPWAQIIAIKKEALGH